MVKMTIEEEALVAEAKRRCPQKPGEHPVWYARRLAIEAGLVDEQDEIPDFPTNERSTDVESNRQRGRHMSVLPGRWASQLRGPGLDDDDEIPF